ncbi:MAG: SH3 domain-containing protein [Clostridiales bacterium]|nr:SH3 domain-containing protein [Clostridiales bacterium]
MKKIVLVFIAILAMFVLSGCGLGDIVREGITGERQGVVEEETDSKEELPVVPAAFPVIGDWFGVYNGSEYLSLRFTADGKCELQPAVYPSDMFGPRYFGDYRWGGDDGREIHLDMYKGVSRPVDYGNGNVWDEWSDGGRENATTALRVEFRVYGGTMKSLALKTVGSGIDTEGYAVVQPGAFVVILAQGVDGTGNPSPYLFGSEPYDEDEGRSRVSVVPDRLSDRPERMFATAELNVRCGPSINFATYGTVTHGTPVDVIGSASGNEDWAFVLLADGGGWMSRDYLSDTRPEQEDA